MHGRILPWIVGLGLVVCFTAIARAELPLSAYREMQEDAPEVVEIFVRSVEQTISHSGKDTLRHQIVEARVESVERSASGLKPGQTIRIEYTHTQHGEPLPGPSQVPILKAGKSYPAFLKHADRHFAPAAGGYSFERIAP